METVTLDCIEVAQEAYRGNYLASLTKDELFKRFAKQGLNEKAANEAFKNMEYRCILCAFNSANPPVVYKLRHDIANSFINHH